MRKFFTLFLMLTAFIAAKSGNATFSWELAGGGSTGSDYSCDVTTDASGNIFYASYFIQSATFNGNTFTGTTKTSVTPKSLLITKLSPTKATLWSLYSNDGCTQATAMATSASGDLYVTGIIYGFSGSTTSTSTANIVDAANTATSFTGLKTSATTSQQGFVAKFNSSGIVQWVKEINSDATKASAVAPMSIAVDGSDNVYVSGTFAKSVLFPGTSTAVTTTNSSQAAYIAKLSGTDGSTIWNLTSSGGIASESISALAWGSDGYLYAGGIYRGYASTNVTIGGKGFTPSTGYDLTLLKIDDSGNVQYIQNRTNDSQTNVRDILVNENTVYIGGSFKGNGSGLVFTNNDTIKTKANLLNGLIASFSTTDGSDLWHKAITSPSIAEVYGLAIGSDKNLYAFGTYYNGLANVTPGTVDFGNGFTLVDNTNLTGDLFLAGYNATTGATTERHSVASGSGSEAANALTSFGDNLYFAGTSNSSPVKFENDSIYKTAGSFDFFIGAYSLPTSGKHSAKASNATIKYDKESKSIAVASDETLAHITVASIAGKVVYSADLNTTSASVAVALSNGVYLVQVRNAKGNVAVQKLLIY